MALDILNGPAGTNTAATQSPARGEPKAADSSSGLTNPGGMSDADLLELFKKFKKESFDLKWIFERQWMRNIYYVLGRQWIFYNSRYGEWQDKRFAKWIPRPVNADLKNGVQAIRAMFASIRLGANIRPNGRKPKNIATAAAADTLVPVLHDEHHMNQTMSEFDSWLVVCGNAFLHMFVDRDRKNGTISINHEQCTQCQQTFPANQLKPPTQPVCPACGGKQFQQATNPDGSPMQTDESQPRGTTVALSPFELAFPTSYPRFDDVPGVIRSRWRTKAYYEGHADLKDQVKSIVWQKTPSERSVQIFKSLPLQNDLGVAPFSWSSGASTEEEGTSEYEMWIKPTDDYPQGLVVRVLGDSNPMILHIPSEGLPGPFPNQDIKGNPLFPFAHAQYEHVPGRCLGSGALDPVINKQDSLNQIDSFIMMIFNRMSNPVWLEPKGSEIEKITGEPGLVIKYSPSMIGNSNAKPERVEGVGPHQSLFEIRQGYKQDIEEGLGTYDILKGAKPSGVDSFSGMQLLVERSQARFSSVFSARGEAYRVWLRLALEMEREFGPEERDIPVFSPARGFSFKDFKNADLGGDVSIIIEDGTQAPKTVLGMRAALQQADQLQLINVQDPDTQYASLQLMGLTSLVPSLDVHVQAAHRKQQAFEEWAADEQAMQQFASQDFNAIDPATQQPINPLDKSPLAVKRWFDPVIHRQEFMKWVNDDTIVQLLVAKPAIEGLLTAHLMALDTMIMEKQQGMLDGIPMAPQAPPPGAAAPGPKNQPPQKGAGQAMANSNRNSGATATVPHGSKETAPGQGPA
jgi:hypothetical protein